MEEQVRLIFNVLEFEEVVDLLCWSIYEDKGALPLKNISYDYYPQLREVENYLETNKNNRNKVYNVIFEDLEKVYKKYYNHSKKMVKRYGLIWEPYNDVFFEELSKYFKMDWPEGFESITASIGRIPVCPRFIKEKRFYVDFVDADTLVDTCMHEICHFMFFMKCKKLFSKHVIDTDNNSLFWYMSEIVIDPILNNNCFRKLFRHKFRSYDSFYKVRIGNELMMDKIHLIFSTNKIDEAIMECYEYLSKHEYEIRKQCGDTEQDEVIEVRMD